MSKMYPWQRDENGLPNIPCNGGGYPAKYHVAPKTSTDKFEEKIMLTAAAIIFAFGLAIGFGLGVLVNGWIT